MVGEEEGGKEGGGDFLVGRGEVSRVGFAGRREGEGSREGTGWGLGGKREKGAGCLLPRALARVVCVQ